MLSLLRSSAFDVAKCWWIGVLIEDGVSLYWAQRRLSHGFRGYLKNQPTQNKILKASNSSILVI
jgi:hypothetical protein